MTKTWKCLDTLTHQLEGASDSQNEGDAGISHQFEAISYQLNMNKSSKANKQGQSSNHVK
jgi:hypothetical protein